MHFLNILDFKATALHIALYLIIWYGNFGTSFSMERRVQENHLKVILENYSQFAK